MTETGGTLYTQAPRFKVVLLSLIRGYLAGAFNAFSQKTTHTELQNLIKISFEIFDLRTMTNTFIRYIASRFITRNPRGIESISGEFRCLCRHITQRSVFKSKPLHNSHVLLPSSSSTSVGYQGTRLRYASLRPKGQFPQKDQKTKQNNHRISTHSSFAIKPTQ